MELIASEPYKLLKFSPFLEIFFLQWQKKKYLLFYNYMIKSDITQQLKENSISDPRGGH